MRAICVAASRSAAPGLGSITICTPRISVSERREMARDRVGVGAGIVAVDQPDRIGRPGLRPRDRRRGKRRRGEKRKCAAFSCSSTPACGRLATRTAVQRQARHFRGRLLDRRADVLLDQAAGEIDVARQHGVAQVEVLVPPPRAGMDHGQPVVAPRLVEQLAAEMQRPRRGAGRHQGIVEALVPLAPLALDADRIVRLGRRRAC